MRLHAEHSEAAWIAFIDADEVHGPRIGRIAARLDRVPAEYDFVDGYTWHFFGSFDYYTSIERRMMFFRYRPGIRWEGAVHEQLIGLSGKRIAVPYVYAHYGHTLEPRRHAEKGRHYSSLGAPGNVLREEELDAFDVARYYAPVYPRLLRFRGTPPAAAASDWSSDSRLSLRNRHHALTEPRSLEHNRPGVKLEERRSEALKYEVRWRSRAALPTRAAGSPLAFRRTICCEDMIKIVYSYYRGGSLLTAPRKL